ATRPTWNACARILNGRKVVAAVTARRPARDEYVANPIHGNGRGFIRGIPRSIVAILPEQISCARIRHCGVILRAGITPTGPRYKDVAAAVHCNSRDLVPTVARP